MAAYDRRISDGSSDVCSSDLVGVFGNAKTLHHRIYQLIDQKSVDRGGYFRFDYAAGPVEATLGGELRVGDVHSRRFVNDAGRRGAKTFDAQQDARTAPLSGEVRLKLVESLSLIAGGISAAGLQIGSASCRDRVCQYV